MNSGWKWHPRDLDEEAARRRARRPRRRASDLDVVCRAVFGRDAEEVTARDLMGWQNSLPRDVLPRDLRDMTAEELLEIAARRAPGGPAGFWACPHERDARSGCSECFWELIGEAQETEPWASRPTPLMEVMVRFGTPEPLPDVFVRAVNEYSDRVGLVLAGPLDDDAAVQGPAGLHLYLLGGALRPTPGRRDRAAAVAAAVGFLCFQPAVEGFSVISVAAARL
ncbi:hypothetical protein GCM10022252_74830 [Streptosporangium oxazolinicum]|uniref:Uncharacterized protein n=1 Tax=Streptosporangium oxazolinicum TaxID=909287 RepID=A0ABP8BKY8_9ACTN